ncbi:hypothetical protein D0U04_20715 [Bacillus clarus]|uniref:Cwf19-like C-terminal domain-containing protein n=1 Tax=Bacillus clarus TaxID=2338372 RepID=A0A090Z2B4_9BACI|nr:hypothetical protein [Bacillus clarus]KFM98540.1 hypothetical protein DJ93_3479 [Bacillus clarus]RFT64899.1 hypothetical protein D0U04_20715 [Bacillus clarus]
MNKTEVLLRELKDRCSFCDEEEDKTLLKTPNFQVRFSVGQIVEGYCLIIPNDHYHCMGSLPENLRNEYLTLKNHVRKILTETYGSCIFYEHGRVGVCDVQPGEQLCYHAHLHAVPVDVDLLSKIQESFIPIKLKTYEELQGYYKKLGHYLYFENSNSEKFIFNINRPIRRQYLRFLTADGIGKPELANWRKHPGYELMKKARITLIPHFNNIKIQ